MRRWFFVVGVCVVLCLAGRAIPVSAQTPTPTPTCRPPQSWKSAADSTPIATPFCPWVADDSYGPNMAASGQLYRVPLWRMDLNNDGQSNVGDGLLLSLYQVPGVVDLATPVYPTPTVCPTCEAGECTPEPPQATYTPEAMKVTEAQGVEFVNGIHTAVMLLAIGIPCLVALVVAVGFSFFNRGRG